MKKQIILQDYINIADIHSKRLIEALLEVSGLMPLTPEKFNTLSANQIAFFDMLIMRFSKLQDVLGAKIFPAILERLGEDGNSFIDKLNKLEKLGYLQDANWWMGLREIRNQVSHDYPDDYELICSHVALLVVKARELLEYWKDLRTKIANL